MADLSVEDKAKGRRIITQFFRTMPIVQKNLMNIFDQDGYEGIYRIQSLLYPKNAQEISSIDTLRKSLSMILQHIYGMPVEDKEGYFQDILNCKSASQVVRKEKETLVEHFYSDLPELKKFFLQELVEDRNFRTMNLLCQKFLKDEEGVSITDMRSFKNHIRNLREALDEELSANTSQEELIAVIREHKEAMEAEQSAAPAEAGAAAGEAVEGEAGEKRKIIMDTLADAKYQDLRDLLLQRATADPNFETFQRYLDNILAPSSRLEAKDMATFSEGVQKIKAFRDNLEQEFGAQSAS
ncbi:hypothetical protein GF339_07150 [candidate division KSB3 bacterium]|uniref:Uncharacterized protein n=1 Tax=candidate division KSB3 bacterium TaxID=2044937 RepID=A0A9D5Q588_9BACT|nr:hypothetical protein [candidate division KSB3 bacterium]MBD3324345.1 hypothetical protein [candidate division KSB3 bacterium]